MRTFILAALLLLLPVSVWSAVALDACTQDVGDVAANNDYTVHTVAAEANYLVVFVGQDSDIAVSNFLSLTWDFGGTAQAMTPVSDNGGTGVIAGQAYTLLNPTPGNKTLRLSVTTATNCCDVKICSFSGVDPNTPLGTIVETESTATDTGDSLAFTLNTGGMAIGYILFQAPITGWTQGADQTERVRNAAGCISSGCEATATTATVSPMDYTWNSTGTDYWHVVLPLNAQQANGSLRRRNFK